MEKKLISICGILLVVVLLTFPVMAAPEPKPPSVTDQILSIVQDIQPKVGTILTALASLQTDVTTIKTTTDTINGKLTAPAEPVRYEYYTGKMNGKDTSSQLSIITDVTNAGDAPANVCVAEYGQHANLASWKMFKDHCYTLNAHWSQTDTPTVITNVSYSRFVKITTDSRYVAPQARFFDSYISYNLPAYEYLPGDFLKVEKYS